jgi:hypothetical protein
MGVMDRAGEFVVSVLSGKKLIYLSILLARVIGPMTDCHA